MLQKQRTVAIDKNEVDFMVLQFYCHDGAVTSALGNHSKEQQWRVQVASNPEPHDIKVLVDKSMLGAAQVRVECNQEKVFPPTSAEKEKLKEDLTWYKQFRGTAKGLNRKDFFEVRPLFNGHETWFRATLTKQRHDGLFEATLTMPDGKGGWKEEFMNAVAAVDIREAETRKPLVTAERCLHLEVPKHDPLHATLSVDQEAITHYFGRPTPPPQEGIVPKQIVHFQVDKKRTKVAVDCGHSKLSQFLAMEPYLVTHSSDRQKHSWTLAIGPNAVHKIEIEKKWKSSKITTLTVDGELLVEAAPEDLDCTGDEWTVKFRFKGEKCLGFVVYQNNKDGEVLDSTAEVMKKNPYAVECEVHVKDHNNMGAAELLVDGRRFLDLDHKPSEHPEDNICVSPEVLRATYELIIPYSLDEKAATTMDKALNQVWTVPGIFTCCLTTPSTVSGTQEIKGEPLTSVEFK